MLTGLSIERFTITWSKPVLFGTQVNVAKDTMIVAKPEN